jgi:hypothetical protein
MLRNDPLMQNDGCSHPDRRNRRIPTSCEFDSLEVFRPLFITLSCHGSHALVPSLIDGVQHSCRIGVGCMHAGTAVAIQLTIVL